jgi:hypothetical protein
MVKSALQDKKTSQPSQKSSVKGKTDSLVTMMREAQHQAPLSVLIPPPVIRTTSRPQTDDVQGGDLLFFEGLPFRYLDHMEEIPAAFSQQSAPPAQSQQGAPCRPPLQQANFPDKDYLLRTITSIVTDVSF